MDRPRRAPAPLTCMAATVMWTWVFLGIAVATGRSWLAFPTVLFTLAGFVGPVVVPSLFILAGRWDEPVGAFWRRCLDPTTLALRWYAIAAGLLAVLVLVPAVLTPGVSLGIAFGPGTFLIVGVLAGAAEEPAWRGYGQAALQRRLPVLAASLVVGALWAMWHLPMFWLEGTYQHHLGIGSSGFWTFLLAIVVASPIYAWLYNASGQVVFAAVFFHAASNLAAELLADTGSDTRVVAVTALVAAVLVAASWRWMRHPALGVAASRHPDETADRRATA
jgi:uncharacterized protein